MWLNRVWRVPGIRLAWGVVLVCLAGALLVFAIVHHATESSWRDQIDARVAAAQADISADIAANQLGVAWNVRATLAEGSGLLYAALAPDGTWLAGNFRPAPEVAAHWTGPKTLRGAPDLGLPPHVLAIRGTVLNLPHGERLFIAADASALMTLKSLIARSFLGVFGTIMALGLIISLLIGRATTRRLDGFTRTLHDIVAGDLTQRIALSRHEDEFDRLAREVNQALARIQQLMENLRQVTNDISHDLRSPLARLREHLELSRAQMQDERFRAVCDEAIAQLDQALAIFSALLRLAEIEAGARRARFQTLALTSLLETLVESYEPAMADGGLALEAQIEPGLQLLGDRDLINQAIANLLDNILIHAAGAKTARLSAQRRDGRIDITLSDDGQGIPAAQRERVMQRFVQLDPTRQAGGYGLGLPLVNAVVALHGGTMMVGASDAGGVRVKLSLPGA